MPGNIDHINMQRSLRCSGLWLKHERDKSAHQSGRINGTRVATTALFSTNWFASNFLYFSIICQMTKAHGEIDDIIKCPLALSVLLRSAAISQISSSEKALSLHFMPLISPRWDSEQVFFGFCLQLIGLWSVGCAERPPPPSISTKGRLIARAPFKGHTIKLCRCLGMDLTEWQLLSAPADVIFGLCRTEFPPSLCFSPWIHRTWEDPPEKGQKSTYVAAPPWM